MGSNANAFYILLKSICIWKFFQILLISNFETFFKILLVDQNWFKIWWILYFVTIFIAFNHILKCMINIFNKSYYSLLLFLCFRWDGIPVKVFEKYLKYFWKVFAFEKFRSICINLHLNTFESIWPQVWFSFMLLQSVSGKGLDYRKRHKRSILIFLTLMVLDLAACSTPRTALTLEPLICSRR